MILAQIKAAQLDARKAKLTDTASLLTTVIGEAEMVGKNARNGSPTDAEVLQILRKFEKNMIENHHIFQERQMQKQLVEVEKELDTIRLYMPQKLTDLQVAKDIGMAMQKLGITSPTQKDMGAIVKELKEKQGEQFDGQQVSKQFKAMLV